MDFFELVEQRRSVRRYRNRSVEEGKLLAVLEAVRAAPSAGNLQAYGVVVVSDRKRKRALARAALDQAFLAQAPVVLVFHLAPERSVAYYGRRGRELYTLQDAAIASTHALLAATDLGLGACWVGAFSDDAVRKILGIPEDRTPVALVALGYAAETPAPTPRRPLNDLVKWETYDSTLAP